MTEKKHKIIWVGKVGKKICFVVCMSVPGLEEFHNGYVESHKRTRKISYDRAMDLMKKNLLEELTYCGFFFENKERWFFGFDTMHFGDSIKTRSSDAVIKRTKLLAEEMIKYKV